MYRLLAIEDNHDIADLVCRAAADMGFEARDTDGMNACEMYTGFMPDVIVLDILMPDKDGLEILQFLKEHHCRSHIIILSGSSDAYRKIAERLGAANGLKIEANLPKPFRLNEIRGLLANIKNSLDNSGERRHGTA